MQACKSASQSPRVSKNVGMRVVSQKHTLSEEAEAKMAESDRPMTKIENSSSEVKNASDMMMFYVVTGLKRIA